MQLTKNQYEGYYTEDFEPIKCPHCKSTDTLSEGQCQACGPTETGKALDTGNLYKCGWLLFYSRLNRTGW